jgi:signal transduction histidine kinase
MLPRDPVTAELVEHRWLVDTLEVHGGLAHFRLSPSTGAWHWSPGMRTLHGLPAEAVAPSFERYLNEFVVELDRSAVRQAVRSAYLQGDDGVDVAFRITRADGVQRKLQGAIRTFAVTHGDEVVLGVLADASEESSARAERFTVHGRLGTLLRYAVVGEVAAGFAHELNQPLTAILNYRAAAARFAVDQPDKLHAALDGIAFQAERATAIVRRMQQVAAVQLGELQAVDLAALVSETLPLLEPVARRHQVGLRFSPGAPLPLVHVDPVAIQLATINLVCNAIEATAAAPAPGLVVEVATAMVVDGLEVTVTDRGIGIDPEAARQLAMPFHRSGAVLPGLGLPTARAIADRHAGNVTLSRNAAGGTTARLRLPIAARHEDAP